MSIAVLTNFKTRKTINQSDKTIKVPESDTPVTIKEELKENTVDSLVNGKVCRVCANLADVMVDIDGRLYPDITILSAMSSVANITINETGNYPKFICIPCLEDLRVAYNFKNRCEASDMVFRKAMPSESSKSSKLKVSNDFSLTLNAMKQKGIEAQKVIEQSNIHNEVDIKYEVPWDDNINHDENIAESGNSSDNEVIISLLKKPRKKIKITRTISKRKGTKPLKLKVRLKNEKTENTNIQPQIVKLLELPIKKETESKLKMKELLVKNLPECKPCELKFDTRDKYETHRRKNVCKYQPCPRCGKLVKNLAMHEKIVHLRSNKYTCDQCGKVYFSSSALCNHLNVHKKTLEYYCDLCPYRAKRKSYLVCHMRVHTGERRYLCSKCPANFSNTSNLRKHQVIHNSKTIECNKCNKTFREQKALKTHFDSAHLNIRYRCSICSKDLCSRKKLLNHELKVHKREKGKLFNNEQKLIISNDKDESS